MKPRLRSFHAPFHALFNDRDGNIDTAKEIQMEMPIGMSHAGLDLSRRLTLQRFAHYYLKSGNAFVYV